VELFSRTQLQSTGSPLVQLKKLTEFLQDVGLDVVGAADGLPVDGSALGLALVVLADGLVVGLLDGLEVGLALGRVDGTAVRLAVGLFDGFSVGFRVGAFDFIDMDMDK